MYFIVSLSTATTSILHSIAFPQQLCTSALYNLCFMFIFTFLLLYSIFLILLRKFCLYHWAVIKGISLHFVLITVVYVTNTFWFEKRSWSCITGINPSNYSRYRNWILPFVWRKRRECMTVRRKKTLRTWPAVQRSFCFKLEGWTPMTTKEGTKR